MTTRRLAISTLVIFALVSLGCRDREITSYRTAKEAAPAPPQPVAAAAPAGTLPADHPPIGGSTSTGTLPADHPPIGGSAAAAPAGTDMASTAVPTASGLALTWVAPASWTPKALGSMRKGSFSIKQDGIEADLSITAFPGATGGLEANLNRWRGQVGLSPASAEEVTKAVVKFESNGLPFILVDYAGNGSRLLGAIVPFGGNSWFFKLTGPDALVTGQKAAFTEFLHTVKENK